jgi:hypothetical protein
MNYLIKRSLIVALGIFLFTSMFAQKSDMSKAKKYSQEGNYVEACFSSIKVLRKSPKKKKAQEILSYSYDIAIEDLQDKIEDLKSASETFQDDNTVEQRRMVVHHYKDLKKLDRQGREIGKIVKNSKFPLDFERVDVVSDLAMAKTLLSQAKNDAAEMHYASGLDLQSQGGIDNNKSAARRFKQVMAYVPGFRESNELYLECKKDGTTRIAIFEFENNSGNNQYGAIGQSLSDQLVSQLMKNKVAMEFVEIVSRDELGVLMNEHKIINMSTDIDASTTAEYGKIMGVHKVIIGKITQISSEQQPTINDAVKYKKEVVIGTEKYTKRNGKIGTRNVKGPVEVNIYLNEKSSVSIIQGSYKMLDVQTGKIDGSSQFNETKTWTRKWYTYYSGDKRAIPDDVKRNYDTSERNLPTRIQMGNSLIELLATKLCASVTTVIR